MNKLPQRKKLSHNVPPWVEQGARHFITVNCKARGVNILCRENMPEALFKNARFYESVKRWYIWVMLLMPDHLHLIVTFNLQHGLKRTISDWKRYQTQKLGIVWQSDFFEHRLRNETEFEEKAFYIRMNPVRKEMVKLPEEWPFVIDCKESVYNGGSPGGLALP